MKKSLYFIAISVLFSCTTSSLPEKQLIASRSFSLLEASTAEEVVGYIWDFIVTDSCIIVSDLRADDLVCVSKTGNFLRRIGTKGQGPCEFYRIREVYAGPGYLGVDDFGNKRLQLITYDGNLIKVFPYVTHVINDGIKHQASVFDSDGNYYLATNGFSSDFMIKKFDKDFNLILSFGALETTEQPEADPHVKTALIKKHELHPSTKNNVHLAASSDGYIYCVHKALPLLKKYSADGSLIYEKKFDFPELQEYRDRHFKRAEESSKHWAFPLFLYWLDAAPDGIGGLYLLFGDQEKMIVFHLDPNGKVIEKLIGPDRQIFHIVYNGGFLWALCQEDQTFYRFDVE